MVNAFRILLVDDEPFFVKVVSEYLAGDEFLLDTAFSGEDALKLCKVCTYDLIIVDITLPGIDGFQFIRKINAQIPNQAIMVISGSESSDLIIKSMQLGVKDYLIKPFEKDHLLSSILRIQELPTPIHSFQESDDTATIHYEELFNQCIQLVAMVNMDAVCETTLQIITEVTGAQSAALWLHNTSHQEQFMLQGYRGLLEAHDLPMAFTTEEAPIVEDLLADQFIAVQTNAIAIESDISTNPTTFLTSLTYHGDHKGLILIKDKIGGRFEAIDFDNARIITKFAAIAIRNTQRFGLVERIGLKDHESLAYNMNYFVDYLGKEIYKAQRYGRGFAIVQLALDNFDSLEHQLDAHSFKGMRKELVNAISGAIRDADLLARVSASEYFILLPETNYLEATITRQHILERIRNNPIITNVDKDHPLTLSAAAAAFPRDGRDIDDLFSICKTRLESNRQSLYRRLHLEDIDFIDSFEILIGSLDAYSGKTIKLKKSMKIIEESSAGTKYNIMENNDIDVIIEELLQEAIRHKGERGMLYIGLPQIDTDKPYIDLLPEAHSSHFHITLIGKKSDQPWPHPMITTVFTEHTSPYYHLFFISEYIGYTFVAMQLQDQNKAGVFHSNDWNFTEGMIAKLQEYYQLQRPI